MNGVVEKLLLIRRRYLAEMAERIDHLDELLQAYIDQRNANSLQELTRYLHTFKGAAAMQELTGVSDICHHWEDRIKNDESAAESWQIYIDVLDEIREQLQQLPDPLQFDYAPYLERLRKNPPKPGDPQGTGQKPDVVSVMIVDNSKSLQQLLSSFYDPPPFQAQITADGYHALGILLKKKFDLLICSNQLSTLSGLALINALALSNCANKSITSIMISAGLTIPEGVIHPTYLLKKDQNLTGNLSAINEKILKKINS